MDTLGGSFEVLYAYERAGARGFQILRMLVVICQSRGLNRWSGSRGGGREREEFKLMKA